MKRFNHTIGFFAAAALAACTGDFESFNTNPDAVQSVDKKTYITTMQMDAVIPCSDVGANEFQRACNLMGDAFGGYLSPIQAFNGGSYTCTYDLDGTDYNNVPFSVAFTNVMPAWLNLKYAYQNGQVTDDVFAVAEVIKVMALQRTTDIYGPIPVSNFGQTENPYESQETVYKNLLTDLNAAIVVLKEYAANAADARPLQKKKDKNLMKTDVKPMKKGLLSQIFHLYYDGFRKMTLGKTLWTIILIKLAIIFLVLKLFFFPDFINTNAKNGDKAGFVSKEILNR